MPAWIPDLQGIGAILSGIAAIIAAIYARSASKEMKPDHGTSLRDIVNMMDDRVKSLGHRQGELHDDIQSLMTDARDTTPAYGKNWKKSNANLFQVSTRPRLAFHDADSMTRRISAASTWTYRCVVARSS